MESARVYDRTINVRTFDYGSFKRVYTNKTDNTLNISVF